MIPAAGQGAPARWTGLLRLLPLLGAALVWAWWLGPQGQRAAEWLLPGGWSLRINALNLLFLTLFWALPGVDDSVASKAEGDDGTRLKPGLLGRSTLFGGVLCSGGLGLAAVSGQLGGAVLGLAVAAAGLLVARVRPGTAMLAPMVLLPVALTGTFDAHLVPGRPVPPLPLVAVLLALAAAVLAITHVTSRTLFPKANRVMSEPSSRPPSLEGLRERSGAHTSTAGTWLLALYGAGCMLPVLRSLGAGTSDGWMRLAGLGSGLVLLAGAAGWAWHAAVLPDVLQAARWYLGGALLLGLGIGSAAAVAGGLALLATGLAGIALAGDSRGVQVVS
ncbi:MAG TPA: hypothetical protein VM536_13410, partial [Chloroflexia bacterium]|nr:hypothetical protein [Chloroflexia bacterium]